jgi:DNA ligase-associated metallophosphoesterase
MQESLTDFSCSFYDLTIAGQTLRLHAGRFAEWREEKTIFLADAHLGKIEHFRRAGFNLPGDAGSDTFYRLSEILNANRPDRLVFLGDLFHSDFNEDFPRFAEWRKHFPETDVWLIPGNHDRAGQKHLHSLGIRVENPQQVGPFFLQHEPGETDNGFLLCGHIHPSISISGKGRQHLQVPAFWHKPGFLCLPAFGSFTGLARIDSEKEDVFFAITGERLRRIPAGIL